MKTLVSLSLAVLALGLGCAHSSSRAEKTGTRCPESRNPWCMTKVECSMDRERGCEVCQCATPGVEKDQGLPSGLPPDRQLPR
jgi:hypothetical protein